MTADVWRIVAGTGHRPQHLSLPQREWLRDELPRVAEKLRDELAQSGLSPRVVKTQKGGATVYRVQVGTYHQKENADRQIETLKSRSYEPYLADESITELYPAGGLQERTIGGVSFLARFGSELLPHLLDALRPDEPQHQWIYLPR